MPRPNQEFQTVRSEGGLLPPDLLRRLLDRHSFLAGTRPEDYDLSPGERLNEVVIHSWNRLRRHYGEYRAAAANLHEGAAVTGLTNDKWSLPLRGEGMDANPGFLVRGGRLRPRAPRRPAARRYQPLVELPTSGHNENHAGLQICGLPAQRGGCALMAAIDVMLVADVHQRVATIAQPRHHRRSPTGAQSLCARNHDRFRPGVLVDRLRRTISELAPL